MFDFALPPLTGSVLGGALLIFVARIADMSLDTVRLIMITRSMRKWAALIGFVEITIWVMAVSQVISNLDNLWNVLAYSGGFATGTAVGMWVGEKLALGHVDIRIISMTQGAEIVQAIHEAGYGATELQASGKSGPVSLVRIVIPRKQVPEVMGLVNRIDPTSFITVDEPQQVIQGYQRLGK